ncbi:hypothetical protein CFC21_062797 [Triticum aestivum]|uniref:F-box domain-containing protein n=3 Tax=Triticinae TaxID=1648030 RepID=A0A9R1GWU4_WHEAT|nr:hypothetical protein CFC21_062797 [Triticum aestivum]
MPPPPPPSRAVAPPPPRRRQRRRLKGRTYNIHVFNYYRYPPPPPVEEERDWTELPLDVTLKIFRCLDPVELLGRVGRVCRLWRGATRDEPELWRRIHMGGCSRDLRLDVFAREAARRSSGRCEAFSGDYFGDDDFLSFLADQ